MHKQAADVRRKFDQDSVGAGDDDPIVVAKAEGKRSKTALCSGAYWSAHQMNRLISDLCKSHLSGTL